MTYLIVFFIIIIYYFSARETVNDNFSNKNKFPNLTKPNIKYPIARILGRNVP